MKTMNTVVTCTTCGSRAVLGDSCAVCDRIERSFHETSDGDAEYYLHEAAHCLVLFRRFPRNQKDLDQIMPRIDVMAPCDKQMTELRALALEMAGCWVLGAASNPEDHINPVWEGLEDVVYEELRHDGNVRGLPCVTKSEAFRVLKGIRPAKRLVDRYVNFVLRHRAALGEPWQPKM